MRSLKDLCSGPLERVLHHQRERRVEVVRESEGPSSMTTKSTCKLALNTAIMPKGAPMKKLIVLSLLMAVILVAAGFPIPIHSQSPGTDLKPTFISPTPGLYVNGWPPFTVSYPKEWVALLFYPIKPTLQES
jgi:hypothetical protein